MGKFKVIIKAILRWVFIAIMVTVIGYILSMLGVIIEIIISPFV